MARDATISAVARLCDPVRMGVRLNTVARPNCARSRTARSATPPAAGASRGICEVTTNGD